MDNSVSKKSRSSLFHSFSSHFSWAIDEVEAPPGKRRLLATLAPTLLLLALQKRPRCVCHLNWKIFCAISTRERGIRMGSTRDERLTLTARAAISCHTAVVSRPKPTRTESFPSSAIPALQRLCTTIPKNKGCFYWLELMGLHWW